MFNCYTHGWTSRDYPCRMCFPLEVTTSTSTTFVYPEALIGISSTELDRLKNENGRLRQSLEIIANGAHTHRGCDPCDFECPVHVARAALEGK